MKKLFLFCLVSLAIATSCKKEEEDTSNSASTEEAAEIIGSAFASDGGGAVAFIQNSVSISSSSDSRLRATSSVIDLKDTTITDTLVSSSSSRTLIYSWTYTSDLYLNPTSSLPEKIVAMHNYEGNYNGPYVSSVHSGTGTSTYTSLGTGTSLLDYLVNDIWMMSGSYDRSGTITKKITDKVFESSTHIQLSDVQVDRVNKKILSGTAAISINGKNLRGEQFSYSGTLTFLGEGQARLVLGDKSFTVILTSGEATAI